MLVVWYPKCSTCQKAKKWMDARNIKSEWRDVKLDNPSSEEIKEWHLKSKLPIKRFFNTSGQVYRNLGLKDKLSSMTDEEQYELLATDGMLVKRPILIDGEDVLVGFKEKEWLSKFGEQDG